MRPLRPLFSILVLTVLATAAPLSGASAQRSVGRVIDDAAITTEIKAKLLGEEFLKGLAISVSTFEGNVTLTGAVKNQDQKNRATELARKVKGVKKVNNLLEIKPL